MPTTLLLSVDEILTLAFHRVPFSAAAITAVSKIVEPNTYKPKKK
jgi:hypothetical protein